MNFGAILNKSQALEKLITNDYLDFFIVKTSLESEYQIAKWKNPGKTYAIAEQLVSLMDVPMEHISTEHQETPLRLNLLLDNLLNSHNFVLPGYVKNLCEWFGFQPNNKYSNFWKEFKNSKTNYQGLNDISPLFRKLIDYELVCFDSKGIYLPSPIFFSLSYESEQVSWNNIDRLLNKIRSVLLNRESKQYYFEYSRMTSILRSPNPYEIDLTKNKTLAKGKLIDLMNVDFSAQGWIEAVIDALYELYKNNPERYRSNINRFHGVVWTYLGETYSQLNEIQEHIPVDNLIDKTNFLDATKKIKLSLLSISKSYSSLTKLEKSLGIDRYFGGLLLKDDNEILHSKVKEIKDITHANLVAARDVFLLNWNLSNIHSIILRLLNLAEADYMTQYFPNNQERVIFLLIDALGFTQLRWFMDTAGQATVQTSISSNIFQWLNDNSRIKDEFILASNLISITGSCLPTIFNGALPRDTGIIGSYMIMEGHHLNILHGKGLNQDDQLPKKEIEKIYRRNINIDLKPFPEIAFNSGVDVQVFHGGTMGFKPLAEYTYGSLVKNKRVFSIDLADRIFAEASSFVQGWDNSNNQKKLAVFYYPLIDSHGHGSGPYTQFQTAALMKLNFVLAHFLIDLAISNPKVFDGKTSLIITADHGMYESSKNAVNDKLVQEILGGKIKCKDMKFVYDNRAMHLYGIPESEIEINRRLLVEYFANNKIQISVITRNDDIFRTLIYNNNKFPQNLPDIILQFYGVGVFYHDQNLPAHRFLYGAHGGLSVEEIFVPFFRYVLTPDLADGLRRFSY
jgi:type I phosphodiesterase/nucleotide pyrophosphatase